MDTLYTLDSVKKQYGERTVLHVPHLHIREGEVLGIVGPSGAGKSTLLRQLAFLEAPTEGLLQIHSDNHTYAAENIPIEVKRQLTMVFQRPVLMTRSVRKNVAYGLKLRGERDIQRQVEIVLERVSMGHLADAHPRTLSGGELQRASIARALVLQPRVLILDEPTANLDPYNVRLIEELLVDQNERFGTTIVIVTHNIFQARRLADRVGLVYEAKLIEIAPTEAFFESPQDERTRAFSSGNLIY